MTPTPTVGAESREAVGVKLSRQFNRVPDHIDQDGEGHYTVRLASAEINAILTALHAHPIPIGGGEPTGGQVEAAGRAVYDWLELRFPSGMPGGVSLFSDPGDHLDAGFKHEKACEDLGRAVLAALPSPATGGTPEAIAKLAHAPVNERGQVEAPADFPTGLRHREGSSVTFLHDEMARFTAPPPAAVVSPTRDTSDAIEGLVRAINLVGQHIQAVQRNKILVDAGKEPENLHAIIDAMNALPGVLAELRAAESDIEAAFEAYEDRLDALASPPPIAGPTHQSWVRRNEPGAVGGDVIVRFDTEEELERLLALFAGASR